MYNSNNISYMLYEYMTVLTLISVIISALQCYFGYKIFKIWCAIFGFFAGFGVGIAAIGTATGSMEGAVLGGLVVAVLCAYFAVKLYFIGVFLYVGFLGFVVIFILSNSMAASVIIGIIAGIAGAYFGRLVIIISSAVTGGYGLGTGLCFLIGIDSTAVELILSILFIASGLYVQFKNEKPRPKDGPYPGNPYQGNQIKEQSFLNSNSEEKTDQTQTNALSQNNSTPPDAPEQTDEFQTDAPGQTDEFQIDAPGQTDEPQPDSADQTGRSQADAADQTNRFQAFTAERANKTAEELKEKFESIKNDYLLPFWDKSKTNVSKAAQVATKKSGDLIEVTKLHRNIGKEESDIKNLFNSLGQTFFKSYTENSELTEETDFLCKQISARLAIIDELKQKIIDIRSNAGEDPDEPEPDSEEKTQL